MILTVLLFSLYVVQVSVLESLRLAVRSQLGFTSICLPTSGRHSNIWRRLFNFTRSRRSGSLALVSADAEDQNTSSGNGGSSVREPERTEPHRGLLPLDSDDTDTESERRDVPGAMGGLVAPLPAKTPPATAVEAISVSTSSTTPAPLPSSRNRHRASPGVVETHTMDTPGGEAAEPQCSATGRSQLSSALSRVTRSLRWVRFSLGRSGGSSGGGTQNHSPLRHLEHGAGTREDEDDVELLIPVSDAASDTDSTSETSRLLSLEVGLDQAAPRLSSPASLRSGRVSLGRNGPCEHCSMVHTAQIPDACLEATGKTETNGDDELLLLC